MRCESCPVRAGLECLGERHPPVCRDVAAGMPGRAGQLVALAEGHDQPEPPGLLAMAGSLVHATVAHVASGMRQATPEEQARREAACHACPHHRPEGDRCNLCGCHLSAKIAWSSSACPDTPPRWTAEPPTPPGDAP